MPKTNWQDPQTSELRSTHISGLMEAVGKIEDVVGMNTFAEAGIALTEVFISAGDRYRIYQAPAGKRNWLASPAPVIKKNGGVISSGFTIDYGGGAIIVSPAAIVSDVFTADATYTIAGASYSTPTEVIASAISIPATANEGLLDYTLSGNTLKNETTYTPSTWAEWSKTGSTADSTGLEITADGSSYLGGILAGNFKPSTNYGILMYCVSKTITNNLYFGGISGADAFSSGASVPVSVGNFKLVLTTRADLSAGKNFRVTVKNTETAGNKIKLNSLRVFELPTGSQIETDFTNLTADQLSAKYPWISGTQSVGDVTLTSTGVNIFGSQYAADKIVSLINNGTYAYKTVVDGRNCLALVGNGALVNKKIWGIFEPNTQYTFQAFMKQNTVGQNGGIPEIRYTDGTVNYLSPSTDGLWSKRTTTSQAGKTIEGLYISYAVSAVINYLDYDTFQIEKGTTATAYQAYIGDKPGNSQVITAVGDRVGSVANSVDNYGTRTRRDERTIIDGNLAWAGLNTVTNTYRMNVPNWGVGKNLYHPSADASNAIGYCSDGEFPVTATASMDIRHLSLYSNDTIFCAIEQSKVNAMAGADTTAKFKAYLNAYPIDLRYQLATPIVTNDDPYPLEVYPGGMVIVEFKTIGEEVYNNGITINNTKYPIKALQYVKKVSILPDGSKQYSSIDLTTVTVAGDGLSYTSTALVNGDMTEYFYEYDSSLSVLPSVLYSYQQNLKSEVANNTKNIVILDDKIEDVNRFMTAMFLAQIGIPQFLNYQVENLAADGDISGRVLLEIPTGYTATILGGRIISHGTAAGVSDANPCSISLTDGTNTIVTNTYNTSNPFPANNVASPFGALNATYKILTAGEKIALSVTNGATADLPAFMLQVTYSLVKNA